MDAWCVVFRYSIAWWYFGTLNDKVRDTDLVIDSVPQKERRTMPRPDIPTEEDRLPAALYENPALNQCEVWMLQELSVGPSTIFFLFSSATSAEANFLLSRRSRFFLEDAFPWECWHSRLVTEKAARRNPFAYADTSEWAVFFPRKSVLWNLFGYDFTIILSLYFRVGGFIQAASIYPCRTS